MENPFEIINERLNVIEKLLIDIYSKPVNSNAIKQNDIMTIKELAGYIDISLSCIYKMTCNREIPCFKRGKRLYFKREEINEWVCKNRKKTMEEIEEEATAYILKNKRY